MNKTKKVVAAGALTAVVAAVAVIGSASAATATLSQCPTGWVCAWDNVSWDVLIYAQNGAGWANFPAGVNDKASSTTNNTSSNYAKWYFDANRGVSYFCNPPGIAYASVGALSNDRFSSVDVLPVGAGC